MRSTSAAALALLGPLLTAVSSQAALGGKQTASVYLFSPSQGTPSSSSSSSDKGVYADETTTTPSYTPKDANAVISSFLNIEDYEILRQGLEIPHQLIVNPSAGRHEAQTAKPLIIMAEQVDETSSVRDYVSESTLERVKHYALDVPSAPDVRAWVSLAKTYSDRLAEKFGWAVEAVGGDVSTDEDLAKRFLLPGALNMDYAFDAALQDETYTLFLSSIKDLAAVADGAYTKQVLHLQGIKELAHKFGPASDEVQRAKEMLRLTVDSIISTYSGKVAFFLVPASKQHGLGGSNYHQNVRSGASADIFSTVPSSQRQRQKRSSSSSALGEQGSSTPIVPTTSKCFDSADAVTNATNSCSGHGSPIAGKKVGYTAGNAPACYVCKCEVTTDDAGRRRYWSGQDCAKEDVSSQVFLIVGSSFLLLFVAIASVSLLSKVGSEPLPSTLAAMGGNAGGHHKRD